MAAHIPVTTPPHPDNHGDVISTLVHEIQSAPTPAGDKNLGQAISAGIGVASPPDHDLGKLVSAFVHDHQPPTAHDFGELVSSFIHTDLG